MSKEVKSQFLVVVQGKIDRAEFPEARDVCVRLSYTKGQDWVQSGGQSEVVSSFATRGSFSHFVIDLPFEATFSSTNPFKWPRLVLCCYGTDLLGHDVVRGYGSICIPTVPGSHRCEVPCFVPQASTTLQRIVGQLWGKNHELVDPSLVGKAEGRQALRVSTRGKVHVSLSVVIKDLKKFGFDATGSSLAIPSNLPLPEYEIKGQQKEESGERRMPNLVAED